MKTSPSLLNKTKQMNTKETTNKQTTKQENNAKHWQIVVALWKQSHGSVYSGRTEGSIEKNYSKSFGPLNLETKKGASVWCYHYDQVKHLNT